MSTPPRYVLVPDAEVEQVVTLLHSRYGIHLDPGEVFEYKGELNHGEANVTLRLSDPDENDVLVLEGHIDLDRNDIQNPNEGKEVLLNFFDDVLVNYFEHERELGLHEDWKEHILGEHLLVFRGSRRNLKLERMADALLAQAEGS